MTSLVTRKMAAHTRRKVVNNYTVMREPYCRLPFHKCKFLFNSTIYIRPYDCLLYILRLPIILQRACVHSAQWEHFCYRAQVTCLPAVHKFEINRRHRWIFIALHKYTSLSSTVNSTHAVGLVIRRTKIHSKYKTLWKHLTGILQSSRWKMLITASLVLHFKSLLQRKTIAFLHLWSKKLSVAN